MAESPDIHWVEWLLLFLWQGQGGRIMKILTGKIVVGAALAISLGAFTIPAGASVPPLIHTNTVIKPVPGIQIAQVARDVDEKADEVRDGATGAVDAVDAAHRRHERNEYRHHTIAGKVDSKIDEAHNEAVGATNAMHRAHERHEAVEHAEGRD
jgi:hypothetical protein